MVVVYRGFADGVRLDAAKARLALERAPALLAHNIRRAMIDMGAEHNKRVKTRFKSWTWGKKTVPEIQMKDGSLRNAVAAPDVSPAGTSLNALTMILKVDRPANGRPYAEVQEMGKTINAKPGGAMTIPLRDILNARGYVLPKYRLVRGGVIKRGPNKGKQGWMTAGGQRTFILKKGDKAYVAVRRGRAAKGSGRTVNALYTLRQSVTLHPRLQFGAEWKKMGEFQQAALNLALERTLAGLTGGA